MTIRLPDPERCCRVRGHIYKSERLEGYRRRRHRCPKCGRRWTSYVSVLSPARLLRIIPSIDAVTG